MSELQLFVTFFYIGLVSIGGGLVAIPIMEQQLVTRGLIAPGDFYNMVAISESTPGPIGINMATFIGYRLHGVPGAILTTLGEVLPSLIIIILVAKFFQPYFKTDGVQKAFYGLRAGVTGMVLVAVMNVYRISILDFEAFSHGDIMGIIQFPQVAFFIPALVVLFKTNMHPILVILCGAVFGIFFC